MRQLVWYLSFLLFVCVQTNIQANLLHRYSFTNGDSSAVDSVGGQHGTLEGGATISGNAVQLDGVNGHVNLPGDILETGLQSVTIEAWFEIDSVAGWQRVFDFGETSGGLGGNTMFYTPTSGPGDSRFVIGTNGVPSYSTGEDMVTADVIAVDTPTHIACVYDGATNQLRLYQDGVLQGTTTTTMQLSGVARVFAYIGDSVYPDDPYLDGSVDEFRIYDTALTEEEVLFSFNSGPDTIGPSPIVIQETGGTTEVIEGDIATDEYTVALASQPQGTVTLTVDPDEQLDVGNGRGNPINIVFDTEDWSSERTIVVTAFDDIVLENETHTGLISHSISSSDPNFNNIYLPSVRVKVWENECGAWGYNYADLNYDCSVNFYDFAIFASYWLWSLNPITLETMAFEWLETTQPYFTCAQHGPIQSSPTQFFVEPNEVVCEIDEKVYGHFLEHIYHSVNGGLWGELVWNRSLEGWSLGVPSHWTEYGTGSFSSSTAALNGDYCLRINNNDGTETGIEQTPFNVTPQQYSGSIWARGTTSGAMIVRLLDGATILGEATLPSPTADWLEYPFSMTPTRLAQDATLQVGVTGTGTVYLDQISMMGQDSIDTGGYRPDLLQAVDDLRPPCIRWPGGCFASLYLWKDGIGPQHMRQKYPAYMWDDQDINSYGTDEFLRMCEALGVEPIIVINTGLLDNACGGTAQFKLPSQDDYLPYTLDWMEYCNGDANTTIWGAVRAANGHPAPYNVQYWEIDNETWAAGSVAYVARILEFAPAMRTKAAELGVPIKIIACGSGGFDTGWNEDVIDGCATDIDYISVHYYENPNNYQSGPAAYENYIINLGNYIAGSANLDMKIYNSEWNAQSTDWRTGLFAGGLLNVYERTSDVFEIGGPALFLRHTSASDWDNAFINFDHTGWFPAPNYVVMKLWRDNYAPYRINVTGPVGSLNAIATKSADGSKIYFKVVNPTDQSVPVRLVISDTFEAESVSMQLIAPDSLWARNTLEDPDAVRVEDCYASLNDQTVRFTMPRLSAGVVRVSREQ